ncbi:MAG: beta-lactamase family protein, partial [candidate division Zixibacteria bacterium]|nr:beta-lactamase family protein [candidate division Zixibacteria bacterium]
MKTTYMNSAICMFTIVSLILNSCSKIPSASEYEVLLEKSLDHGFPSIILAIQRDQEAMWIGAKGVSNIERQIPMRTDDRFHIASVTNIFTATAILKLIDQGALSLTSKVVDILDNALVSPIPHIKDIQVYHLLDHSSGIYSFNNDMEYVQTLIGNRVQDNRHWSPEELIALSYGQRVEPAGKPGSG